MQWQHDPFHTPISGTANNLRSIFLKSSHFDLIKLFFGLIYLFFFDNNNTDGKNNVGLTTVASRLRLTDFQSRWIGACTNCCSAAFNLSLVSTRQKPIPNNNNSNNSTNKNVCKVFYESVYYVRVHLNGLHN